MVLCEERRWEPWNRFGRGHKLQETFGKLTVTTREDFPFRPVFRQSKLSLNPSAKYFPMGGSLWLPAQHHTQRLRKNSKALWMAGNFIYLPFTWAAQLADKLHSTLKWESSRQRSIRVSNENYHEEKAFKIFYQVPYKCNISRSKSVGSHKNYKRLVLYKEPTGLINHTHSKKYYKGLSRNRDIKNHKKSIWDPWGLPVSLTVTFLRVHTHSKIIQAFFSCKIKQNPQSITRQVVKTR